MYAMGHFTGDFEADFVKPHSILQAAIFVHLCEMFKGWPLHLPLSPFLRVGEVWEG